MTLALFRLLLLGIAIPFADGEMFVNLKRLSLANRRLLLTDSTE